MTQKLWTEKEERSPLFPLFPSSSQHDPSELSISADGRTRVHVPIMELLKRFREHSDVRPRQKVSRLKCSLNALLIKSTWKNNKSQLFTHWPFSFFYTSLRDEVIRWTPKKNMIPATTSTFHKSSRFWLTRGMSESQIHIYNKLLTFTNNK